MECCFTGYRAHFDDFVFIKYCHPLLQLQLPEIISFPEYPINIAFQS